MSADPITPATRGGELPPTPLTRADKPQNAPKTKYGRLVRSVGSKGRPFVSLATYCPRCRRMHYYAWRHDWPLETDIRSFQASRCPRDPGPQWLGLDKSTLPDSIAVHTEARVAYLAWQEDRARRRAEREAAHLADAMSPNSLLKADSKPTPAT